MPESSQSAARRILVLTSSTGSGHDRRAYAFKDWVSRLYPDGSVDVKVEHLLENSSPVLKFGVHSYNIIQRHAPWLHNIYWWIAEGFGILQGAGMNCGGSYYRNLLLAYRPHIILSLHDSTNRGYIETAKKILGADNVRCVTYCGEYSGGFGYSRIWVSAAADFFYSRTQQASDYAQTIALPPEKHRIFFNFLPPSCFTPPMQEAERPAFRESIGLLPDRFTLLLAASGQGAGAHLDSLQALAPLADRVQCIVVCGKNESLYQRVADYARTCPLRLCVEGYSTRMPELLQASDSVLARGGANLSAEAAFFGVPLLIDGRGGIMPQERLTLKYFHGHGAAKYIPHSRALAQIISQWASLPADWENTKRSMQSLKASDHPEDFVKAIVAIAETVPQQNT